MASLRQRRKTKNESCGLRVLLVLRDAKAARAHSLALQLRGCQVTVTSHLYRAMELAIEELPDLILTDAGDRLRQLLAADPRTRQITVLGGAAG
jgi:PleD family two-component response regulator